MVGGINLFVLRVKNLNCKRAKSAENVLRVSYMYILQRFFAIIYVIKFAMFDAHKTL